MQKETVIEPGPDSENKPGISTKAIIITYNILSLAVGLYLLFKANACSTAIAIAFPMLGLILGWVSKGNIKITPVSKRDFGISVNTGIMMTILFMLMSSFVTYRIFSSNNVLLFCVFFTLIFLTLVYLAGALSFAKGKITDSVFMIVFAVGFGYGTTRAGNCVFDRSPPDIYKVVVLNLHEHHGSKSDSYYAEITPWGPVSTITYTEIDYDLYNKIKIGDTIRVNYRQGLFHVPWYLLTQN
jgi:hypothetical protein